MKLGKWKLGMENLLFVDTENYQEHLFVCNYQKWKKKTIRSGKNWESCCAT